MTKERKLIYSINVTADGFADHTSGIVDDELHDFFTNWLMSVDTILFGRKTYELMEEFWPVAYDDPRSTKSMLHFADRINSLPKVVFSKTLNKVTWKNTTLVKDDPIDEILKLKKQPGNPISVGGINFASYLVDKGLIDEFWFLIHPVISGKGKPLFEGLRNHLKLQLSDTKIFKSGVVVLHYLLRTE